MPPDSDRTALGDFSQLGRFHYQAQVPQAYTHDEAPGRHFHFSVAPTSLLEVIPKKLPLDGVRVHANLLTKIG